jgi:hypothetical protein
VLQSLYAAHALSEYELISTVSGGGYPVYGLLDRMIRDTIALRDLLTERSRYIADVESNAEFIGTADIYAQIVIQPVLGLPLSWLTRSYESLQPDYGRADIRRAWLARESSAAGRRHTARAGRGRNGSVEVDRPRLGRRAGERQPPCPYPARQAWHRPIGSAEVSTSRARICPAELGRQRGFPLHRLGPGEALPIPARSHGSTELSTRGVSRVPASWPVACGVGAKDAASRVGTGNMRTLPLALMVAPGLPYDEKIAPYPQILHQGKALIFVQPGLDDAP